MTTRPTFIKAGGEILASKRNRKKLVADLIRWHKKGPVVLVHGAGPQIKEGLKKHKISFTIRGGRRVTSKEAMTVIEQVWSGEVNKGLVADLVCKGIPAVGLSCRDGGLLLGQPTPGLGRAGHPKKVNPAILHHLLKNRIMPVIATVASDNKGQALNINADDAASALGIATKAKRLIFLTNVSGVLDRKNKRIPKLKTSQIQPLIKKGVIHGGMIPKVQSAENAIKKGVGEVDILNGTKGIQFQHGTRIVH